MAILRFLACALAWTVVFDVIYDGDVGHGVETDLISEKVKPLSKNP